MLRTILALAFAFAALSLTAIADDEKKGDTTKLEGKLCCTKCKLGETDKCGHALIVKESGKDVTYYLDDKGGKEKYHGKVCQEDKDAVVTGKVVEKDGKKHIESPKVEIK